MSMSRCAQFLNIPGRSCVSTSNCRPIAAQVYVPIHRYLFTFTEYLVHSVLSWNPSLNAYWAWLQNGRLFAPRTPLPWGFRETISPGSLKKACSEKWGAASSPLLRRRRLSICRSSKQPTKFPTVSFVFFPLFSFISSQRRLHTKSG